MEDDHWAVWEAEHDTPHERAWQAWADGLEALLGHDLDGSLVEDGYALDHAYDMFMMGWTIERAKDKIEDNKARLRHKRGY